MLITIHDMHNSLIPDVEEAGGKIDYLDNEVCNVHFFRHKLVAREDYVKIRSYESGKKLILAKNEFSSIEIS